MGRLPLRFADIHGHRPQMAVPSNRRDLVLMLGNVRTPMAPLFFA